MDADDLKLFESSLRQAAVRRSGTSFDDALDELGWSDALADEPAVAASLFAVQGEFNLSSSAIDDVVLNALGLGHTAQSAVVLPAIGTTAAPGTVNDDVIVIHGIASQRILGADRVVVVTAGEALAVDISRADLGLRPIDGIDPAGGWVEVTGAVSAPTASAPVDWAAALVAGQLAIAKELTAAARAMLALARHHAAERVQFGRPIGSFQAVRHRLADGLIAVESADAAVTVGWAEPSPFSAAMAKAIAGRSSRTVARHAQQVLAGMGFTSEHAFHHYLKRTMVLDQLLGSSTSLSAAIGDEVLASGQLPSMLAL